MPESCDFVIANALIHDGTGAQPRPGAIGVRGEAIVSVGKAPDPNGAELIDASGLALAPGFIDVHTHDDRALLIGDMSAKVSQGVTTVIVGNCGVSLAPLVAARDPPPPLDLIGARADFRFPSFAAYFAALEETPPSVNALCLVGHSTLREGAMDRLDRAATEPEIAIMRAKLGEALDAGAIGLSTGLAYAPSMQAPTEEVAALAELLGPAGAIHTTHMRDEGEQIIAAMDEAFAIGRVARSRVVISHFKVHGQANYGRSPETLDKFDRQRQVQELALDAYPYAASSTILEPAWIAEATKVMITWSIPHSAMSGRTLRDIAEEWGCGEVEAAERLQPAGAVYFAMDEEDVRRILSYSETMIGSDGLPHDRHPHPRLWGSFPRVLGHYARDIGLFPLEEAIRRMTSLPAENFGLKKRGRIAPGQAADLVLFDPDRINDCATFEHPTRAAEGIDTVWVNGRISWQHGRHSGARAGHALRRGTA